MNTIKKLTIENFQSHQRTVIDLAPAGQLTIITGRSRSGKTAIIRALRWLLYNDPRGVSVASSKPGSQEALNNNEKSGYCRVGASFIRVTAEMESGHKVIRERTAATNRYKIIAPGATEPITFEGFGDNVPLEIQELTGVRPIRIDDKNVNLNLSEQLDSQFLGSKSMSAPARAKVLGKLAGTEEIDYAGKQLGTDLFRRGQDERRLAENLKELDEKIAKYDYLPDMKRRIDTLEQLMAKVKTVQARRDELAGLKEQLCVIVNACLEYQKILSRWSCLDAILPLLSEIDIAQERNAKILELRGQFSNLDCCVHHEQNTIHFWRNVDNAALTTAAVETARRRMVELEWQSGRLVEAEDAIADCHGTIDAWQGMERAELLAMNTAAAVERRRQVVRLHETLLNTEKSITAEKTTLKRLAEITKANDLLLVVPAMKERRNALHSFMAKASGAESMIKKARENAVIWENRVYDLQGAYRDELVTMGVCPMCGNNIDLKKLEEAC